MKTTFRIIFLLIVFFSHYLQLSAQVRFDADSALQAIAGDPETSMQVKTMAYLKLDSIAVAKGIASIRGDIYARLAGLNYNVNPGQAIAYYKTALFFYNASNNKPWMAFSYLNIGSVFDEMLHAADSAVFYMNQSYQLWVEIGDITQQANVLKYLGLLKAKVGHPEEGIKDVQRSIVLFKKSSFPMGVAVAYFDLAGIWEVQNNSDSALYYYSIAKQLQTSNADTFRIIIVNNKMLGVYLKKHDLAGSQQLVLENEALNPEKFIWQQQLSFYKNCIEYYDLARDEAKKEVYKSKLSLLTKQLKAEGVQVE